jgi:hypothetical protein
MHAATATQRYSAATLPAMSRFFISLKVMESISAWNEASMMLSDTPTVHQRALAIGRFDQHPGDRLGAAIEDAHLVVDQFEIGDLRLVDAEILPQRDIERVDRAVDPRPPTSSPRRRPRA